MAADDRSRPERAAGLPPVQMGLLGRAIETSRQAVLVSTHERDLILAANQAACELLGYTREELLQTTPLMHTTRTEAEIHELYGSLGDVGSAIRSEARLKRRDGSHVAIGYWGSWVHITGVDYLLTVTDPIETARYDG